MTTTSGTSGTSGSTGLTLIEKIKSMSRAELSELPLDMAVFYMCCKTTISLDDQVKEVINRLQTAQENIKKARDAMNYLDKFRATNDSDKGVIDLTVKPAGVSLSQEEIEEIIKFLNDQGICDSTGKVGNADAEKNKRITEIKTGPLDSYIKEHNTVVEMENLSVQNLMSQRGNALEMSTNIMKKTFDTKGAIIRNF